MRVSQITGLSKVVQSTGQAFAPIVAAQLLVHVGPWAPWALIAALQAATLGLYLALGLALHKDPDWSSIAFAGPPVPSPEDLPPPERATSLGDASGSEAVGSMSMPLSSKAEGVRQSQSLFGSFSNLAVGEALKTI